MAADRKEHARIRDTFGFSPTEDFFQFWQFAKTINPQAPDAAFNSDTGISLVGPFDLLAGRFDNNKASYDPCLHWRHFGDPPEFVTILTGGGDGLHYGYIVDRPQLEPLGIAGYYAHDDVSMFAAPSSPFGVLRDRIESELEQIAEDVGYFPEMASDSDVQAQRQSCHDLRDRLLSFCSKHGIGADDIQELDYIEQCNQPPFAFPEVNDFDRLPQLIEKSVKKMVTAGTSETEARLRLGRFLWHWHHDGNAKIQECAFTLLDGAYAALGNDFLRHVLLHHAKHRHRPSLDVFGK